MFQQQRRSAGWRLGLLLNRGALLQAVARTTLAVINRSSAMPGALAQLGRIWAESFIGRRFLAGQRRAFAVGWSWPETTGGRWIPNFNANQIVHNPWGSLTFNFTDCNHGKVDFNSVLGYGAGSMNLTRLTQPAGLTCP